MAEEELSEEDLLAAMSEAGVPVSEAGLPPSTGDNILPPGGPTPESAEAAPVAVDLITPELEAEAESVGVEAQDIIDALSQEYDSFDSLSDPHADGAGAVEGLKKSAIFMGDTAANVAFSATFGKLAAARVITQVVKPRTLRALMTISGETLGDALWQEVGQGIGSREGQSAFLDGMAGLGDDQDLSNIALSAGGNTLFYGLGAAMRFGGFGSEVKNTLAKRPGALPATMGVKPSNLNSKGLREQAKKVEDFIFESEMAKGGVFDVSSNKFVEPPAGSNMPYGETLTPQEWTPHMQRQATAMREAKDVQVETISDGLAEHNRAVAKPSQRFHGATEARIKKAFSSADESLGKLKETGGAEDAVGVYESTINAWKEKLPRDISVGDTQFAPRSASPKAIARALRLADDRLKFLREFDINQIGKESEIVSAAERNTYEAVALSQIRAGLSDMLYDTTATVQRQLSGSKIYSKTHGMPVAELIKDVSPENIRRYNEAIHSTLIMTDLMEFNARATDVRLGGLAQQEAGQVVPEGSGAGVLKTAGLTTAETGGVLRGAEEKLLQGEQDLLPKVLETAARRYPNYSPLSRVIGGAGTALRHPAGTASATAGLRAESASATGLPPEIEGPGGDFGVDDEGVFNIRITPGSTEPASKAVLKGKFSAGEGLKAYVEPDQKQFDSLTGHILVQNGVVNRKELEEGFDLTTIPPKDLIAAEEQSVSMIVELNNAISAFGADSEQAEKIMGGITQLYPNFLKGARTNIGGEIIDHKGRHKFPDLEPRLIYSNQVKNNSDLEPEQKAPMRGAVHKNGEIIDKPDKITPRSTAPEKQPELEKDQ